MPNPFGSPRLSRNPYDGSAENRVVLVAIHGGLLPPIFHERNPLQRMRVAVLPPDQNSEFDPSDLLPGVFRRALPPMPPVPPMTQDGQLQARPVRGEILRGDTGRLYEKVGDQIRPLHRLRSGHNGQVLELTSSDESDADASATVDDAFRELERDEGGQQPSRHHQWAQSRHGNQNFSAVEPKAESAKPVLCRKIFPDPGQQRVVRFCDFKGLLIPQLAHPERLRDTHRLACHVQVYEVTKVQRLEALAASVLSDPGRVSELQLMAEPAARQLGLTSLLRTRPRIPSNFPREAGLVLPYERVFRLQLAHDPTADDTMRQSRQPAIDPHVQINEPLTPAPNSRAASPANSFVIKTAIPERFLKPWEFKLTRDEALYDMNVRATFAGWFNSLTARLKSCIRGRGELKKWQVLLSGKSADEQLWAVRPPRGNIRHSAIRDWAYKTLETAGYDPRTMLLEWEIFWRRKGL